MQNKNKEKQKKKKVKRERNSPNQSHLMTKFLGWWSQQKAQLMPSPLYFEKSSDSILALQLSNHPSLHLLEFHKPPTWWSHFLSYHQVFHQIDWPLPLSFLYFINAVFKSLSLWWFILFILVALAILLILPLFIRRDDVY